MRWQENTLRNIIAENGLVQTGPFGSQLHQSDYTVNGVPVVMPTDICDGRIIAHNIARVSDQTATRLSRHKLKPRTIVLPRRGEIAKRAFVRDTEDGWLCGSGCLKIEVHNTEVLPEFLYYYMATHGACQWLVHHAVGTTMLNLSAGIVANIPVRYPHTVTQARIASILSAYDDLIENNRRRITLLEDSARQLYREWFVRLRFPGHERCRIKDGVPEGWERKRLRDVIDLKYGKALKADDRVAGEYPVYGSSGVVGTHAQPLVTGPGIIVGRKGNVGSVFWVNSDSWPIDTAYFVRTDRLDYWLYHNLLNQPFTSSHGAVPGLNREAALSLKAIVPNYAMRDSFQGNIQPTYDLIQKLDKTNVELAKARDLLLPKLMSGEIEV